MHHSPNPPARSARRSPLRGAVARTIGVALASCGVIGMPAALATTISSASTQVSIEHSAVEKHGWDLLPTEWAKVETMTLGQAVRAESVLPYTSSIDTRLTMTHQARAAAEIVKGPTLGKEPKGPSLKVETWDKMVFDGNDINRADGTAWRHSRSELEAEALLSFDLRVLTSGPMPHKLVFHWQIDGGVDFDLFAPVNPVGADNYLSVYAKEMNSVLTFSSGLDSPACPLCVETQAYAFGVSDRSLSTDDPRYDRNIPMKSVTVMSAYDRGSPELFHAFFRLHLQSTHDLWNNEFANSLLEATLHADFYNSATLLGVQALDAEGRTLTDVSYLSSDPELYIPVYGAAAAVPEPATMAQVVLGLALVGLASRSRRARRDGGSSPAAPSGLQHLLAARPTRLPIDSSHGEPIRPTSSSPRAP